MIEKYKQSKWVVGVSGGIDSMALLDVVRVNQMQLVVCHINYHKRKTSDFDESVVGVYCAKYQIPFYVAHFVDDVTGNFQAKARVFRYDFYASIAKQTNSAGVMLAHHRDDFIETAILRERQGRSLDFYGIKKESIVNGLLVVRPLLDLYKSEIADYVEENKIPYGQDESNFEMVYERNKIRNMELVNKTKVEKEIIYHRYQLKNLKLEREKIGLKQEISDHTLNGALDLTYFNEQVASKQLLMLREFISNSFKDLYDVSDKFLSDVMLFIKSNKAISVKSIKKYLILKEYNYLSVIEKKSYEFNYSINALEELDTPYFKIRLNGNLKEGLYVEENEFPLTIRNVKDGDRIAFAFGHKSIKRYFIDNKIAYLDRVSCPIIENKAGEVIFVCNLGANIEHFTNKPNLFVVK